MPNEQHKEPDTLKQHTVAAPQTNATKGAAPVETNTPQPSENNKPAPALAGHNVFADPKLQHDPNRTLRIRRKASTTEREGELGINVFIPLSELQKAKRGTTAQHRGIGFALEVEFAHPNGNTYTLTGTWVTINPR
jgi:hypothetical protein